jgi:hypothetical protein
MASTFLGVFGFTVTGEIGYSVILEVLSEQHDLEELVFSDEKKKRDNYYFKPM